MHTAQYDNGCDPDNLFIHNKTACLDDYRNGWKHWCNDTNEGAKECNEFAKQGIIPDNVRNQTLVDFKTNLAWRRLNELLSAC
jgi:hypothetical protein